MKKFISMMLCVCMVCALLTGCESNTDNSVSKQESKTQTEKNEPKENTTKETIAGIGETLDYNGLKFTLDSVEKYTDKEEFVTQKPAEGNIFIKLNFTVTNDTGKDEYINMLYEDSYCDDVAIDPVLGFLNEKSDTVWGDVANSKKRVGYVGYEVPENWKELEFYYKAELLEKSSKMMFKVTSDKLQ